MSDLTTFAVSDIVQKLADQEKLNVSLSGIDDTCYGLVISADKSFDDFLSQHHGPLNFQPIDGDPIRILRRPINDALTFDFTLAQADCIKPSKDAPVYDFSRPNPLDLPGSTVISYLDVDRFFITNTQEARHRRGKQAAISARQTISFFSESRGVQSRVIQSGTLDFIMSADQVRQMAYDWHYRTWTQAPFSFLHPDLRIEGGDTILFNANAGQFSLLVNESTITPDRLNKIDATVFLTSSGISILGGRADTTTTFIRHVGTASGIGTATGVGSQVLGSAGSSAGVGTATAASVTIHSGVGLAAGVGSADGEGPFNPSALSPTPVGWYDASTSVTDDGSGNASVLPDLSGLANDLSQGTLADRPVIVASGLNSLTTLNYPNNPTYLSNSSLSGFPATSTGILFACVIRAGNISNGVYFSATDGSGGQIYTFGFDSNRPYIGFAGVTGTTFTDTTNYHVWSGAMVDSGELSLYLDGSVIVSTTLAHSTIRTPSALSLGAFLAPSPVDPYLGKGAETIIATHGSGTPGRQKLEGYLAWKWGLQANLPLGHPYKSAPP